MSMLAECVCDIRGTVESKIRGAGLNKGRFGIVRNGYASKLLKVL
jgi:hypothetical protein